MQHRHWRANTAEHRARNIQETYCTANAAEQTMQNRHCTTDTGGEHRGANDVEHTLRTRHRRNNNNNNETSKDNTNNSNRNNDNDSRSDNDDIFTVIKNSAQPKRRSEQRKRGQTKKHDSTTENASTKPNHKRTKGQTQ